MSSNSVQYNQWLKAIKEKIQSAQIKAATTVNSQLIELYWELGEMIVEKQEKKGWGAKIIDQMATDLKRELPDTKGFSRTNLFNIRQFYLFYRQSDLVFRPDNQKDKIVQQAVGQTVLSKIPCGHHILT